MNKSTANHASLRAVLKQVETLRQALHDFKEPNEGARPPSALSRRFVAEAGSLIGDLQYARELISPIHFGAIGITLGRSDSIAKFFAFSFTNQDKRPLHTLADTPFFGSGVYAIYYHGKTEKAYLPLSGSETPIYVGKADQKTRRLKPLRSRGSLSTSDSRSMPRVSRRLIYRCRTSATARRRSRPECRLRSRTS
jgi:hypothetical protein